MESIALRAATVMPILLLQKPHAKAKTYGHVACLERRLASWQRGDIDTLVQEGRTIQRRFHLASTPRNSNHQQLKTRKFAKLMSQGKVKAALRLLEKTNSGGVLPLNSTISPNLHSIQPTPHTVREVLIEKHPPGQPAYPEILLTPPAQEPHPVLFDQLDGEAIRTAALKIEGAAGPSGVDANGWRRLCISFKAASSELCNSLALLAR